MKRQNGQRTRTQQLVSFLYIPVSVVPGSIHWGTSKHPVSMDYPLSGHPAPGTKFREIYGKSGNEMYPFLNGLPWRI
jgi:hypothetical protein